MKRSCTRCSHAFLASSKKRGMSPVVGTVLLVSLVVVLAGSVFAWAYSFISDKTREASVEKACGELDFISGQFCKSILPVDSLDGSTEYETYLEFDVRNEVGEDIVGFSILASYNGNSVNVPTLDGDKVYVYDSERIYTGVLEGSEEIDEIVILPKVLVDSKAYYCEDKGKSISWEEIEEC